MLEALAEFVRARTTAEEIDALREGQGLLLPSAAGAEVSDMMAPQDPAELTANVVSVRNLMPGGDLFHTAVLALLCGTLVERGADPGAAIDATLDLFIQQLDALAEQRRRDDGIATDGIVTTAGQLTFMATMTMLSRSVGTRKRWRGRPELMARLDGLEEAGLVPWFLREVFTLHDDVDLLLLDPKNRRAYQFRMVGVRDRLYHCYALLQDALLRHTGPGYLGAEPVDPDMVRYARNRDLGEEEFGQDDPGRERMNDHLRFNFSVPGAVIMPGSASPSELPTLDGLPFLLVEPKGMSINWNPSNMYGVVHEALAASVELVRELDRERAEVLLVKCGF
ncbi:hypothetical protein KGQ19_40030 [Catenulispora sp. NL8]|uniref:Uncharacterized protein n=1 Tax=Catenulispora pinistramenti TaxID=2705254 RepID=A0ABS5L4A5_9ACTN|nr:hypothetical protein [Catenulispora pinistramenti]MBS2553060.1 hypothetical protein [Catenulispora pinistramenti]